MDFEQIYKISAPYTVTSKAKMRSLYEAVKYINQNHIKGSFVECGVYRGGSVMNMALTQQTFSNVVHIYLFDTYEGMTPPGEFDVNHQDVEGAKIISIGNKRSVANRHRFAIYSLFLGESAVVQSAHEIRPAVRIIHLLGANRKDYSEPIPTAQRF
jgi:hypothetical protein